MKTTLTLMIIMLSFSAAAIINPELAARMELAANQEISDMLPAAYDEEYGKNIFDRIIQKADTYHLYAGDKMLAVRLYTQPIEGSPMHCGPVDYMVEIIALYDAFIGSGTLMSAIYAIGGETSGIGFKTIHDQFYEIYSLPKNTDSIDNDLVEIAGYFIEAYGVETGFRRVLVVESIDQIPHCGTPAK